MQPNQQLQIDVCSEVGKLEGVIIHTPGVEVEEMTPENAKRALYSDILNLSVAGEEYATFKKVLNKVSPTFEVKDLLSDILTDDQVRKSLLDTICHNDSALEIIPRLMEEDAP